MKVNCPSVQILRYSKRTVHPMTWWTYSVWSLLQCLWVSLCILLVMKPKRVCQLWLLFCCSLGDFTNPMFKRTFANTLLEKCPVFLWQMKRILWKTKQVIFNSQLHLVYNQWLWSHCTCYMIFISITIALWLCTSKGS